MATNIDERIVAAKFDASDFEKGVNKTIKKLDELKKSLDLKDATKGVKELAEKTEASTDSMSKSLEKLTERFTTFVGMIKQRILGGLADEVANAFLRMEQSVTRFIRSISTDQINAGLQKYQSTLTSVRQMVNAGYDQETVYKSLERLRTYTDETSYSFEQMADAMSKMVAAGVNLDQATKNVEGIANACANAGINANEAQRAFFNLSQAFTKGKLEYTDYKSLELLNMTNEEFTKACMEAAVAAETLTKSTDKLGNTVYKTSNKVDKKVKGGKVVNLKNFTDSLKYDFMNTEAMNKLFGSSYWMEIIDKEELKKLREELGDEEFEKRFGKIATKAYQAAYEARSFLDVINAIKDAASSNWATTFEYLFGKLEDAKNFFTNLSNSELADVVYKIGEYRNAILGFWDDSTNGIESGGGAVFRQTIENITEALGTLLKTILDILPGFREFDKSDGEMNSNMESLGDRLFELTMRFRDFSLRIKDGAERFREFMNSPVMENGPTRIELIRETLSNLGSVLGIFARVASIAFNTIIKTLTVLNPIFDGFLVLLAKVTAPIKDLKNNTKVFKDIEYSIDNIFTVLNPVAEVLGKVVGFLGEVGAFFAQMAIDTVTSNIEFFSDAIGLVFELFTNNSAQMKDGEGVLARIQADFEGIKTACQTGLNALKEFFGALLGDIRRLFGLTDEAEKKSENQNGGIFSGLTNFFNTNQFVQDAKAWVNQAIVDVTAFIKSIPSRIMQLGGNIYDTLRGLFFKDETKYNGSQLETKSILTPLGEWVNQAIIDIKNFFISLPQKIIDGVGKVTNWIDEVFNYWFNKDNRKKDLSNKNKSFEQAWVGKENIQSRFEEFIENAKVSIGKWFEDLPNKIRNAFSSVGNFASNLYNALDEFLFGKKITYKTISMDKNGSKQWKTVTTRYKSGFSKWLDGIIKDIRKFISNIPEYIKAGIIGAGDIISSVISALFGKEDGKEVTSKDVTESLEKPFLGIDLGNILNTIAGIGREILNQIARIFTGTDDIDKNMEWFSNKIAEGINWIREKVIEGLNWLSTTLADLPTTIANLFTHEDKDNANAGPVGTAIIGFGEAIGTFITETLPDRILEFIRNATTAFDNIWNELYNKIVGGAEESSEEVVDGVTSEIDAISSAAPSVKKPELTAWQKFINNLGQTISDIWEKLPVWIARGIDAAIVGIDNLIKGFTGHIADANFQKKTNKETEKTFKSVVKGMADSAEEGEASEESGLLDAIKGIGERIKTLFIKTIPGFISEAWTAISDLGSDLYKGISSAFTGEPVGEDASELTQMANNAGTTIKTFLVEKVPEWFTKAWDEISTTAKDVFAGISSIFTGATPENEVQSAVRTFGETIYRIITTDIPAAIKKAFDFVKGLFTKKDPLEENLNLLPDSEKAYVSRYVDKMKKDTKKVVEDEAENPESWSFIDGIKEGFLNAFNSIGPAILNGLATALNWIGDIVTIIIDAMTGKKTISEQIDDAYKEENPELKASLKRIGESLKNFFLDTIPKFIGAAIGSLQREAPKWFAKLFGAMSDAAQAEGKKAANEENEDIEKAANGVMDIMGIVHNIFDSLQNFIGENKSILGILSYITKIVDEGDPDKIERFNTILDKLKDMMVTLADVMKWVGIGKIAGAFGDLATATNGMKGFNPLGMFTDLFSGVMSGAGVGLGTYLASAGISAAIDTFITTISDTFLNLSSSVGTAIEAITPAVDKLEGMYDKLDRAKKSVEKIKDLFTSFFTVFESLYSDATGKEMTPNFDKGTWSSPDGESSNSRMEAAGMELYMKALQNRLDLFLQLSVFINELATALNNFPDAPEVRQKLDEYNNVITDGTLTTFFMNLFNCLKTSIEASNLSPELLGAQYSTRTAGIALALNLLADSLKVFSNGISGLNEENIDAVSDMIGVFGELAEAFGDNANKLTDKSSLLKVFTGDTSLSKIGEEIKLFGYNMKAFYDQVSITKGFNNNEIAHTNTVVHGIVSVMGMMADLAPNLVLYDLKEVTENLPGFGTAIGVFFNTLDQAMPKDISTERADILAKTVESISSLMSAVTEIGKAMTNGDQFKFSEIFDALFKDLGGNDERKRNAMAEELASILIMFDQAIQQALGSEQALTDYEGIGSTLATRLISGLQQAIDTDPTLRITPVLNLDTAEQQLRGLFGVEDLGAFNTEAIARAALGANNQTDQDVVRASELRQQIGEVKLAIDNLAERQTTLDQLTAAFSRLKMYINKDRLVGEITDDIDYRIGLKIDLVNSNIST